MSLKVFFFILSNSFLDSFADFLIKKGMIYININLDHPQSIIQFLSMNIFSPLVWLGISLYVLNFFLWIFILSNLELTVAIPWGSLGYIFAPLLSVFFLKEHVGRLRWAGTFLIILGLFLISKSSSSMTKVPA